MGGNRKRWYAAALVAGAVAAGCSSRALQGSEPVPAPPGSAADLDAALPTGSGGSSLTTTSWTAASSTTTTTEATTTTTAPRSFTLAFTGDVLIHSRVWEMAAGHAEGGDRAFDFGPMLEPLRPFVEAVDWAVCHLEVPLSADGTGLSSYPAFRAPGDVAHDLAAAGYDACSTASNHTLDAGVDGALETLSVLEAAGLRATGTARSAEEEWDGRWYQIGGARFAHLSYSYGFNGFRPPVDAPWLVRAIDEELILADAARARAEGAELVILSLHWGEEYRHEPDEQQRTLGPRLLASPDVDLIVGHHAHVVQPIERINGEWLVYGVGNLLHNMTQPVRRDELLVQVRVAEQPGGPLQVEEVAVVPLHVDGATLEVLPAGPALRPPDVPPALAEELDASWARTLSVLERGSGYPDLVVHG